MIGKQKADCHLKVVVDNQVLAWNMQPQMAEDRTENSLFTGLSTGEHHVEITVVDGTYTLDAVEWLV